MMEFGKLEKRMLQDMVQLYEAKNLCIYSWMSKLFDDKISFKGVIDGSLSNCRIEIRHNGFEESEILSKIKYFYFLYKRLEKTNLIDLDLCGTIDFNFKVFEAQEFSLGANTERILYGFLSMLGNKPILVSHYIIDLVDNDFKTTEQRQFEQQLEVTNTNHNVAMRKAQKQVNIAWGAFCISLLTLLYTLNNETKINQSQLNQIKQSIEQKTLPEVFNAKIINDTLTTKVVEMPKVKPNR